MFFLSWRWQNAHEANTTRQGTHGLPSLARDGFVRLSTLSFILQYKLTTSVQLKIDNLCGGVRMHAKTIN